MIDEQEQYKRGYIDGYRAQLPAMSECSHYMTGFANGVTELVIEIRKHNELFA
jgi:hypothetical protein